MSIKQALKWSFASELVSKAIQPTVFIVITRLLTPKDFGVMTAAMMIIGLSQVFWEAGMAKAIIQRQTEVVEAANAAFIINLTAGLVISLVVFLSSNTVANLVFQDERVSLVLKVMSLQIVLGALSSVQTALLQKEMGFKKLFWVRLVTISVPGLASIPLALHGAGYWALVAGSLVGQTAQTVMLWFTNPWRPTLQISSKVTAEIGRFGSWVGFTGLLTWFYAWADSLVVGHYLGSHDLGLYRTGSQFVSLVFTIMFSPIMPVLYSHISQTSTDSVKLCSIAGQVVAVITVVVIPVSVILSAYSSVLQEVVFGPKWMGLSTVITAMAIMQGYSWIVGMNGEFYRAIGKPNYEAAVTSGTLLIYLGVYSVTVRFGLGVFVWSRMWLAIAALIPHLLLMKNVIGLNLYIIVKRSLLISGISVSTVWFSKLFIRMFSENEIFCLTIGFLVSGLSTFALIFWIEKEGVVAIITRWVRGVK